MKKNFYGTNLLRLTLAFAVTGFSNLMPVHDPELAEPIFTEMYEDNHWNCPESVSGWGSTMVATRVLRMQLPTMLKTLGVRSILDAPCGDFVWMKETALELDAYFGADIVQAMVEKNQELYGSDTRAFIHADLTKDPLPKVDAIFCRECAQHLPDAMIFDMLKNFKRSGATYLMITTHVKHEFNKDGHLGSFRRLNLQIPPFNFPEPLVLLYEGRDQKYLGVWKLEDLDI